MVMAPGRMDRVMLVTAVGVGVEAEVEVEVEAVVWWRVVWLVLEVGVVWH